MGRLSAPGFPPARQALMICGRPVVAPLSVRSQGRQGLLRAELLSAGARAGARAGEPRARGATRFRPWESLTSHLKLQRCSSTLARPNPLAPLDREALNSRVTEVFLSGFLPHFTLPAIQTTARVTTQARAHIAQFRNRVIPASEQRRSRPLACPPPGPVQVARLDAGPTLEKALPPPRPRSPRKPPAPLPARPVPSVHEGDS